MAGRHQRPPVAVDIIESEELLQLIHPKLLALDYNNNQIKVLFVGGSFAFFAVAFSLFTIVCNFIPAFQNLGLKFRVFLSLSIVRGIFGFFASVIGLYAIFCTTNLNRDVVFGTTATSSVGMFITVGFFIFELAAVVVSDIAFKTFSKMLIAHHALGVVVYSLSITLSANFCIGCKALLLEMSTPFSCLSYVLLKIGLEHTALWRLNQMVLVHSFHLRSLVECHMWYVMYSHWYYIRQFMPTSLFILTLFSLVTVTFLMTPYWGYKKTQQLFNPVDWNFQESRKTKDMNKVEKSIVKKTL